MMKRKGEKRGGNVAMATEKRGVDTNTGESDLEIEWKQKDTKQLQTKQRSAITRESRRGEGEEEAAEQRGQGEINMGQLGLFFTVEPRTTIPKARPL